MAVAEGCNIVPCGYLMIPQGCTVRFCVISRAGCQRGINLPVPDVAATTAGLAGGIVVDQGADEGSHGDAGSRNKSNKSNMEYVFILDFLMSQYYICAKFRNLLK